MRSLAHFYVIEKVAPSRQAILRIAQNGANPGPLKNLVEIQTAIEETQRSDLIGIHQTGVTRNIGRKYRARRR